MHPFVRHRLRRLTLHSRENDRFGGAAGEVRRRGSARAGNRPRRALGWLSETELARVDALDEGRPLLLREGKRRHLRPLRIANQVLVIDLRHLDAGTAGAPGALDPFRRIELVHCGLLSGNVAVDLSVRYYRSMFDSGAR